uniref:Apolipoprotein C-II n=2 Tax=Alligator mississippiensis TaxID=8496 RepID=APOC2_ALLMI|nr:RecName: Full=Apolipoprotein C-II; Short=Apo-CII; Short=ApoC-II; AltName: Full=Apolipoprotein C2; Contains: RecName: Full=Proapolipoprotein C-II; Short=ProapoC-II; Flags: Precursor [Alligator mississippiensis]
MDLKVVAVSFLLLVLCSEAAGYQLLTWEQANTAVKGVLDKVHSTGVEKLRDIYDKSVDAVGTYTSILTDQLYHWWCGEQ